MDSVFKEMEVKKMMFIEYIVFSNGRISYYPIPLMQKEDEALPNPKDVEQRESTFGFTFSYVLMSIVDGKSLASSVIRENPNYFYNCHIQSMEEFRNEVMRIANHPFEEQLTKFEYYGVKSVIRNETNFVMPFRDQDILLEGKANGHIIQPVQKRPNLISLK
jgi:hypothetical protein